MKHRWTVLVLVLAALVVGAATAQAEETVLVGTKEAPPFSMKGEDGTWEGLSIELWNAVAADLGYETEFRETDLEGMVAGVKDGSLDVAVAALTMTPAREREIDFTHPFFTSGLGIAAKKSGEGGWSSILSRVFSSDFLKAVLALAGILALAGVGLWVFERRRNREQFGGTTAQGLGNAFWWSAVTMTTVGYGDKAPVTLGGRLVGLIWMFASIILIAGFTAGIASALTVSRLEGTVHGPEDLPGLKVGTVPESTSEQYLVREGIGRRRYATVGEALDALVEGEVDAVVYDHPLLVWRVGRDDRLREHLTVLPRTFERQNYAIALPQGSARREALNQALLTHLTSEAWDEVVERFLGP